MATQTAPPGGWVAATPGAGCTSAPGCTAAEHLVACPGDRPTGVDACARARVGCDRPANHDAEPPYDRYCSEGCHDADAHDAENARITRALHQMGEYAREPRF